MSMSEPREPSGLYPWMVLVTVSAATMLYAMSITIANVALPQMQGAMSATQDQISWVITFNILATGVATPASGWLIGRLGRRRLMLWALLGFTISSILCGTADSLESIILYRIAQGMFGAPLIPLSQTILLSTFPRERHGLVTALWGFGVVIGPLIGPTIGGEVAEILSWRWVFYMIAPIGVLAMLLAFAFIRNSDTDTVRPLDWPGFLTLSFAITATQLMMDRGQRLDWFASSEIIIEAIIAATCFYFFVYRMLTARQPFFDFKILRDRNLFFGLIFALIFGMLNFTPMVMLPTLLRETHDFPDSIIGWLLAARAAGNMLSFLVVVPLTNRWPRFALSLGFGTQAASCIAMTWFDINFTTFEIGWTSMLQGFGVGMTWVPLTVIAFSTLQPRHLGEASSMFHLLRNIGSSIFISICMALIIRSTGTNFAYMTTHVSEFREVLNLDIVMGAWQLDQVAGLAKLNSEIGRQAFWFGNLDAFFWLAVVGLLPLPLMFLVKRATPVVR